MTIHDLLIWFAAGALLVTGFRIVQYFRDRGTAEGIEFLRSRAGLGWLVLGAFALVEVFLCLGRLGVEDSTLKLLVLVFIVALPVFLIQRSPAWLAFLGIVLLALLSGAYSYMTGPRGLGFDGRWLWFFLMVFAGSLAMAALARGRARAAFAGAGMLAAFGAVCAFVISGTLHDTIFWTLAVLSIGSAVMLLASRSIVHMAFWLLSSLAGFAGFYLLLGADFLGFAQVLVYIGGILILFLFGVMLTHRVDVPVRGELSWRVLVPGVVAGVGVTALLAFLAGGNNWAELPPHEVASLGPVERSADGTRLRPLAEPTAFGLGTRFMSTYILPFEVVSVLLLVAMIGATYIARGRSEGDVSDADERAEEGVL